MALANRHITNAVNCLLCQVAAEDIKHALFTYTRAKNVWALLGIEEHIQRMMVAHRLGWVRLSSRRLSENGGEVKELNLGRAELILTGAGIFGDKDVSLLMVKISRIHQDRPCQ